MNIKIFLKRPRRLLIAILKKSNSLFPDELYLRILYKLIFNKKLDLVNPKTFNEKLNWLKLYDRNPLYTKLVDKRLVKEWVANKIGVQYVIPTIGVYESFDDIDFDKLPNQFVLKTTHGGGNQGVVICKNKDCFNKDAAKAKLIRSLGRSAGSILREWPYQNVHRCIIAEQYLEDVRYGELRDYKFFCFNGEVKALFVATGRQKGEVMFDYFDADFNHLDLKQSHPMSGKIIEKPATFDEMKRLASILSEGIPQVRCDLYEVNGKVYFGEMTFYHHGGIVPFHPDSWDYTWGSWISLPNKMR